MNERGYWTLKEETDTHVFDEVFAKTLHVFINTFGWTALDIGCGKGDYVKYLKGLGVNIEGHDGSPLTPELSDNICGIADFSEPQNLGKFDIVMSVEVGEHIPVEHEQVFIDNVCRHARKWIILTWAIEGQGGVGHVNCRNNDYIIGRMAERGWSLNDYYTQWMRKNSTFDVFKNTIMVYEKHTT